MVGAGLIICGLTIAIAVVLGPLISGAIDFRTSESIENQFVGSEIVSLVLVAPIAIASGILWLRRNRLAPALAFAPTFYSVYTYASAVLGQEYGRYEGNIEKAFSLNALLVAGSVLLGRQRRSDLLLGHQVVRSRIRRARRDWYRDRRVAIASYGNPARLRAQRLSHVHGGSGHVHGDRDGGHKRSLEPTTGSPRPHPCYRCLGCTDDGRAAPGCGCEPIDVFSKSRHIGVHSGPADGHAEVVTTL
jgi:hypothetical protein